MIDGCPCLLVTPCSDSCSCAHPMLSGGCRRCCKHGSLEQRTEMARHLSFWGERLTALVNDNQALLLANRNWQKEHGDILQRLMACERSKQ